MIATVETKQYHNNAEKELHKDVEKFTTDIRVTSLEYSHIPAVMATIDAASINDPLEQYVHNTPDAEKSRLKELLQRARITARYAADVQAKKALTVDKGDAFVTFGLPGRDTTIHNIVSTILKRTEAFDRSPEQLKRWKELKSKLSVAIEAALGDRLKEMVSLDSLATNPKKQGRGYGTALVASVSAKADAEARSTWLCSSNILNTGFYESCGFTTIAEFTLGEANPTWDRPPVIIRLMERKPQTMRQWDEKLPLMPTVV